MAVGENLPVHEHRMNGGYEWRAIRAMRCSDCVKLLSIMRKLVRRSMHARSALTTMQLKFRVNEFAFLPTQLAIDNLITIICVRRRNKLFRAALRTGNFGVVLHG